MHKNEDFQISWEASDMNMSKMRISNGPNPYISTITKHGFSMPAEKLQKYPSDLIVEYDLK